MDKLQHIDELLRRAAQEPANALVHDSDWDAIEKKLGRRKNRITFMWFFLALVSLSLAGSLFYTQHTPSNIVTNSENINNITNPEIIPNPGSDEIPVEKLTLRHQDATHPLSKNTTSTASTHNFSEKTLPKTTFPLTQLPITIENPVVRDNKITKTVLPIVLIPKAYNKIYDFDNTQYLSQSCNGVTWKLHKPIQLSPIIDIASKNPASGGKDIEKDPPKVKSHWEVGPAFTPSLSGKFTSANKQNPNLLNPLYESLVAKSEKNAFANSYGINVQFHPASRFFISSGLFVTQRTEQVDYDYEITNTFSKDATTGIVTSYPNLKPGDEHRIKYAGSNSYHFIEIPLSIGFKQPISPIFELRSQIGLSYLALIQRIGKKGDAITLELLDLANVKLNQQNIAANVKTGLYYNRSRFAIGVEPMFGLNLNSLSDSKTALIKSKPYSYGLNISTNFKLLKK